MIWQRCSRCFDLRAREIPLRDVFYFSKVQITISDIVSTATELGFKPQVIETCDGKNLNVFGVDDVLLHWIPIDPLGRDFSTFEELQQERIRSQQPVSGFIISFHLHSSTDLVRLLKCVLERFGGWLGCDDNTFETIYTSENLEGIVKGD